MGEFLRKIDTFRTDGQGFELGEKTLAWRRRQVLGVVNTGGMQARRTSPHGIVPHPSLDTDGIRPAYSCVAIPRALGSCPGLLFGRG